MGSSKKEGGSPRPLTVPEDSSTAGEILPLSEHQSLDVEDASHFADTPRARLARAASTTPKEAVHQVLSSWVSRRFFTGCAVLFPLAVTVYITWWFLTFFDKFFSPLYVAIFKFKVFGLGFITSMLFIFVVGAFAGSWLGGLALQLGEWIIKKLPLVKHIYSAAKQVSAAVNPSNETSASFRECVIVRHPRHGEYAIGFITGQTSLQDDHGQQLDLFSVYIPTNHVYVGDIFLMGRADIIKPNLSVREGLEIVVSVGMALPRTLKSLRPLQPLPPPPR
ncbi:hypothetical protein WJX73_000494 [Symbiochloris irregularis]|uniref:Uncharacterized protein n=1 Tax=Symbiochloris irregularis TaxID=706552 RepID=A0AAW1PIY5_9CHLO